MTREQYDIQRNLIKEWLVGKIGKPAELYKEISRVFNISENSAKCILFRLRKNNPSLDTSIIRELVKPQTPKFTAIEQTETFKQAAQRQHDKDKQVFFITYAQNHTAINEEMLVSMETYANFKDASIHVIAGRYKNPTSVFTDRSFETWDTQILKYLDANRHDIHPLCSILSDVKVQPTAATPLSGFNGITGLSSCIIGHPRMHLKSLPVLKGYPIKILCSTGAITVPNYTDSKAGKKGEFHHNYGFAVIELDGDICHIRQVTVNDDGSFNDLYHNVSGKTITPITSCKVATLGDIHLGYHCEKSIGATLSYLNKVVPKYTILHDLFDGASINHHEMKDPFTRLKREQNGSDNLQQEIDFMLDWIEKHKYLNLVIVRSNHDDFLDRWLINSDWHKSQHKFLYLKFANIIAEGLAEKGLIPYLIDQRFGNEVKTLGVNDSFRIDEIEYAMHGDRGANGSRGSAVQFKELNTKSNTAHTHSDSRLDGHFVVGCLTGWMPYVKGLSSWTRSIIITHNDDKRQHIRFIDGKFTTAKL